MSAKNEIIVAEATEEDGLVEFMPAEAESLKAEQPTSEQGKADKKKGKKRRWKSNGQLSTEQVISWFSACARCSFFLAGYQVKHGVESVRKATENSHNGWLDLDWSPSTCGLVVKSYGSRLDIDCYHFDGVCPECQREYVLYANGDSEKADHFRIELKPRNSD